MRSYCSILVLSAFFFTIHAQAQLNQELDPVKAEALALSSAGQLMEPLPSQVEKDLRAQGIIDTQKQDMEVSPLNFPVGTFPMGITDFIVVRIHRDRIPQFAEVFFNGNFIHSYWVSTGAEGYETPAVTRTVYERNWNRMSKAYGGTMTGAMMYMGGYGVHMTPFLSKLGKPASHGCVRMEDAGVYALWKLAMGTPNSNITIQVLEGENEGIEPEGKPPYQGGRLQKIQDVGGKPTDGRPGAMSI